MVQFWKCMLSMDYFFLDAKECSTFFLIFLKVALVFLWETNLSKELSRAGEVFLSACRLRHVVKKSLNEYQEHLPQKKKKKKNTISFIGKFCFQFYRAMETNANFMTHQKSIGYQNIQDSRKKSWCSKLDWLSALSANTPDNLFNRCYNGYVYANKFGVEKKIRLP